MNNLIATKENLHKRGLTKDKFFQICRDAEDIIEHLLHGCSNTRPIWLGNCVAFSCVQVGCSSFKE